MKSEGSSYNNDLGQVSYQEEEAGLHPSDSQTNVLAFSKLNINRNWKVAGAIVVVILALHFLLAVDSKPSPLVQKMKKPEPTVQVSLPYFSTCHTPIPPHIVDAEASNTYLPDLSETKTFSSITFQYGARENGTIAWFTRRELTCKVQMEVRTSKLGDNFYMQSTAYGQLNILTANPTASSSNVCQYQPIRQLIYNLALNTDNVIAYCHNSPLLLLLTASTSSRGLLVCNQTNWDSFRQNLILNDQQALAQPYSSETIYNSNAYNILISDDPTLIKTLLYEQKKAIELIMEIRSINYIETKALLSMEVYRFEKAKGCNSRKVSIYQQPSWKKQKSTILEPGWYVFKPKGHQDFAYTPRNISCIKKADYKSSWQALGSKHNLTTVPFEGLLLLKAVNDTVIDQAHYREIVRYFQQKPVQSVYLHSGPYYLMMLLISTLPKGARVALNPGYKDHRQLKKNMVLNELEVELLTSQDLGVPQIDLVVTQTINDVLYLRPKSFILAVPKATEAVAPEYTFREFNQITECNKTSLFQAPDSPLPAGTYFLIKKPS